jgi:hypothetical protein
MKRRISWQHGRCLLIVGAALALAGVLPALAYQRDSLDELRVEDARRQSDHVDVRVLGKVRNVDDDGRRFQVETPDVRFVVEYDRSGTSGFGVRMPRLREGDRVIVYGRLVGGNRVLSDRIVVVGQQEDGTVDPRRLTGQVRLLDRRRSRVSVRDTDGAIVDVEYNDRTVLARLGRRATPEDIRVGDTVWAEGRWQGRDTLAATRVEITASTSWYDGASGEVVAVDRSGATAQVRFGRETRRVDLVDASFWVNERRVPARVLRPGTRARFWGEPAGSTIRARRVELLDEIAAAPEGLVTVQARVRFVDPGAGTITIQSESGSPAYRQIYVSPQTTFDRFGRRVTLRDIQTGDRIRAQGTEREGRFWADLIEMLR